MKFFKPLFILILLMVSAGVAFYSLFSGIAPLFIGGMLSVAGCVTIIIYSPDFNNNL